MHTVQKVQSLVVMVKLYTELNPTYNIGQVNSMLHFQQLHKLKLYGFRHTSFCWIHSSSHTSNMLNSTSTLNMLPAEILEAIFSFLGDCDLVNVQQVSKQFRRIVVYYYWWPKLKKIIGV